MALLKSGEELKDLVREAVKEAVPKEEPKVDVKEEVVKEEVEKQVADVVVSQIAAELKPGYMSSELWMLVFTTLLNFSGYFKDHTTGIAAIAAAGVYALARTWLKK